MNDATSQVGVALDETTTESDLDDLFWVFKSQARLSKVLFVNNMNYFYATHSAFLTSLMRLQIVIFDFNSWKPRLTMSRAWMGPFTNLNTEEHLHISIIPFLIRINQKPRLFDT